MANKRISQLTNTATAFRSGDYIVVDGTDTAKMSKDDLLKETAENAVDSGVAGSGEIQRKLDSVVGVGVNHSVITLSSFTFSDSIIDSNDDVKGNSNCYAWVIPVADFDALFIQGNGDLTSYAFLTEYPVLNSPAAYCDGTTKDSVAANGILSVKIPNDCKYVFVWNRKTYYDTKAIVVASFCTSLELASNLSKINGILDKVGTRTSITLSSAFAFNGIIDSNDNKYKSNNNYYLWSIPVDKNFNILTFKNLAYPTGLAFVTSAPSVGAVASYCDGTTREVVSENDLVVEDIPSDCSYVVIWARKSVYDADGMDVYWMNSSMNVTKEEEDNDKDLLNFAASQLNVTLSNFSSFDGILDATDGKYKAHNSFYSWTIPVESSFDIVKIIGNSQVTGFAFVRKKPEVQEYAEFSDGCSVEVADVDKAETRKIPSDCVYIFVWGRKTAYASKPIAIETFLSTSKASEIYPDFSTINGIELTDVFGTMYNVLMTAYTREGVDYIGISDNLGKSYTEIENTIGDIVFYHVFLNGTILIASPEKCYYIDRSDRSTLNECTILDKSGNAWTCPTGQRHFWNQDRHHRKPFILPNGKEILVWGDYKLERTWDSSIWYTTDNGHTIKQAFVFDHDGLPDIRHVHDVGYSARNDRFYVVTGDDDDECTIGTMTYDYANDVWAYTELAHGPSYKFGQLWIDDAINCIYLTSDYTVSGDLRDRIGVYRSSMEGTLDLVLVDNIPASFLGDLAINGFFEDESGIKVITPDYKGVGTLYVSENGFDFKKISLDPAYLFVMSEPNYKGDVYSVAFTNKNQLTTPTELKLNRGSVNLTTILRKAGIKNFGRRRNMS